MATTNTTTDSALLASSAWDANPYVVCACDSIGDRIVYAACSDEDQVEDALDEEPLAPVVWWRIDGDWQPCNPHFGLEATHPAYT